MNTPLTYGPAYLGLYASLVLAVACNAFLDIQYGSFGFEMFLWAAVLGWTLRIGWKQQGRANESGPRQQKLVLVIGAIASALVFIPVWGFPRAGLYMLIALQAAMNCVTTTRRQLHFGLLVSAVIVIFAASHYRADWTMLFYLIPYIVAVVFTLVSEQISRRAMDLRRVSLGDPGHAGQGIAVAAATAIILTVGMTFYLVTPQVTWPYLSWRYGQLTNIGFLGEPPQETGKMGQSAGHSGQSRQGGKGGNAGEDSGTDKGAGGSGQTGKGEDKAGHASPSGSGSSSGSGSESEGGYTLPLGRDRPTPAEMREAARRPGMPKWQSAAIMQMASIDEATRQALAPIMESLKSLLSDLKKWLKENQRAVQLAFLMFLALAMLLAVGFLLRDAKAATWLRTRFDYLSLGILGYHLSGADGARQYYGAMERLFVIKETPRAPNANVREFLKEITTYYRGDLRADAAEFTRLFEQCRYGPQPFDESQLGRMRVLYRAMFRKLGSGG